MENPPDFLELLQQMRSAVRFGDRDEMERIDHALGEHPHPRAGIYRQYLAETLCRMNDQYEEALARFRSVERAFRDHEDHFGVAVALRGTGRVYRNTLQVASAVDVYKQALEASIMTGDSALVPVRTLTWRSHTRGLMTPSTLRISTRWLSGRLKSWETTISSRLPRA